MVVLAVDTLRADHLGCYGYARPTSPNLDALAAESVVFDTAIATAIPTMPSFTTLLTGLHPYRTGVVSHIGRRRLAESVRTMPSLARERGYVTAGIDNLVVQGSGRGTWFARGFDHYSGFLYRPFGDQSRELSDRALDFIQAYTGRPLFLFVHYWDPHTPYGPRPPYDTLHYEPGSGPVDLRDVIAIRPQYYEAFLGDMKLRHPDDYAYVVAQYDGEISQVDEQIGRVIEGLREAGEWERTILVLVSDHGECFGEGGFYFDHHGLYDANTRVALMMRLPGFPPRRVGALVSTEDLLPTLGDLLGLPKPPYRLTGTSLVPLLRGESAPVRPFVVSAESTRQASLALRTPEWKVILPITEDARGQPIPDFYGRPRDPRPLLFDLLGDPGETRDLSTEMPGKLEEMLGRLRSWREETLRATGEHDPILEQGLSLPYDRFMERLLARR